MKRKAILLSLAAMAAFSILAYWRSSGQVRQPSRAEALLREALPHLEQALGYKLPATPELREVSPQEFERVPGWELKAFLHWKYPSLSGASRDAAYRVAHHADCAASACRHVEGTKIILVAPEHLKAIAGWSDKLRGADSDAFLQLVLVHEAARLAMEQRHRLLDRRHDPQSLEELQIGRALRDGRAQWLTRAVARRLGTDELFPLLAERFLHVPDAAPDAQLRMVCQTALHQRRQAHLLGLAFFDELEQRQMRDVESVVFQRPPRQLAWLQQPELYLKHARSTDADLRDVLEQIKDRYPLDGFQAKPQPWTPTMLRQVAEIVGLKEKALENLPNWDDGRTLVWSDSERPGRYVALTVVRFSAAPQARSYYGFAVDLQRKRDEVSATAPLLPLRTVASRFAGVRIDGLQECVRNDKTVQPSGGGRETPVTILLGRADRVVVELQWVGVSADTNWAQRVITECLR